MELKNRLYPYPVLNYYSDDFTNSFFEVNLQAHFDDEFMYLDVDYSLQESTIENLLKERCVELVCHIECPTTSFRELYRSKEMHQDIKIRIEDIAKELQLNFFVIAREAIDDYSSENFNEMYEGSSFHIDRNTPLAIGKQVNIPIDKDADDFKNITSIFLIMPVMDSKENHMSVSFEQERIQVYLSNKMYQDYSYVAKDKLSVPMLHSILLQPVLIETFNQLKIGYEDYRDYKWCKSLLKTLMDKAIINKEDEITSLDGMKVAQKLLNDSISESLEYLFKLVTKDMTDDED